MRRSQANSASAAEWTGRPRPNPAHRTDPGAAARRSEHPPRTTAADRLTRDDTQSTASSCFPRVDAFGTTLLFTAGDGNLVPGDDNQNPDVFRRLL
ncbi:hypothetical protein [Kitasatospora sp. NPDC085464]|uniref:hypothetical protein n=1 Tax=Kitasatospora sp. NPDC085464 TaxID=3364063 RepID=UPI0037C51673